MYQKILASMIFPEIACDLFSLPNLKNHNCVHSIWSFKTIMKKIPVWCKQLRKNT